MQIFVKLPVGSKSITLNVDPEDSISSVKWQIQGKENIAYGVQELQLAGTTLRDEMTLADYNVQKNTTIRMNYALQGAGKRARGAVFAPVEDDDEPEEEDFSPNDTDVDIVKTCLKVNDINLHDVLTAMDSSKFLRLAEKVLSLKNGDRFAETLGLAVPQLIAVEDRPILVGHIWRPKGLGLPYSWDTFGVPRARESQARGTSSSTCCYIFRYWMFRVV